MQNIKTENIRILMSVCFGFFNLLPLWYFFGAPFFRGSLWGWIDAAFFASAILFGYFVVYTKRVSSSIIINSTIKEALPIYFFNILKAIIFCVIFWRGLLRYGQIYGVPSEPIAIAIGVVIGSVAGILTSIFCTVFLAIAKRK